MGSFSRLIKFASDDGNVYFADLGKEVLEPPFTGVKIKAYRSFNDLLAQENEEHLTVENPTGHSFASIARAAGKAIGNAPFGAQGCIPTDSEILHQQQSIPKSNTSVVTGRMTPEIRMLNQAVMRTHGCAIQVPAARIRRTCRQARVAKRKEKEEGTYVLEACPVGLGRRN